MAGYLYALVSDLMRSWVDKTILKIVITTILIKWSKRVLAIIIIIIITMNDNLYSAGNARVLLADNDEDCVASIHRCAGNVLCDIIYKHQLTYKLSLNRSSRVKFKCFDMFQKFVRNFVSLCQELYFIVLCTKKCKRWAYCSLWLAMSIKTSVYYQYHSSKENFSGIFFCVRWWIVTRSQFSLETQYGRLRFVDDLNRFKSNKSSSVTSVYATVVFWNCESLRFVLEPIKLEHILPEATLHSCLYVYFLFTPLMLI